MKISSVKGMHDILPPESALWHLVEETAREIFARYGYAEVRTPLVEKTALFERGAGRHTTLVQKEMYSFIDQGNEALTLRPEATASVVRAYIENGIYQGDHEAKYYYFGPMFRRERPQKGRYRQFHQVGVELFGAAHSFADAEIITMATRFLEALGTTETRLEVNSLGCHAASCRPKYQAALQAFFASTTDQFCEDCQRRLKVNPLRIFDCKNPGCQKALIDAPTIHDYWCEECRVHFQQVCEALDQVGIKYWTNHRIARGLDYYIRTAFEIMTQDLGAQSTIVGGGRYDALVKDLGGPEVPGVGFAFGLERLILLLQNQNRQLVSDDRRRLFVAAIGPEARTRMLPLMEALRAQKWCVEWDYDDRSLKSQMRRADRLGVPRVVIVGDEELGKGIAVVRHMETKEQVDVPLDNLVHKLTSDD